MVLDDYFVAHKTEPTYDYEALARSRAANDKEERLKEESKVKKSILETCHLTGVSPSQLGLKYYSGNYDANSQEVFSPLSSGNSMGTGSEISLQVARYNGKIRWAEFGDNHGGGDLNDQESFCFDEDGRLRIHLFSKVDRPKEVPVESNYSVEYDNEGHFIPEKIKFKSSDQALSGFDPETPPKPKFSRVYELEQRLHSAHSE